MEVTKVVSHVEMAENRPGVSSPFKPYVECFPLQNPAMDHFYTLFDVRLTLPLFNSSLSVYFLFTSKKKHKHTLKKALLRALYKQSREVNVLFFYP